MKSEPQNELVIRKPMLNASQNSNTIPIENLRLYISDRVPIQRFKSSQITLGKWVTEWLVMLDAAWYKVDPQSPQRSRAINKQTSQSGYPPDCDECAQTYSTTSTKKTKSSIKRWTRGTELNVRSAGIRTVKKCDTDQIKRQSDKIT